MSFKFRSVRLLYSGSISGIEWREQGGNNRGYNYTFDKNKRLTRASYYDAVGGDGRFSTSYSYDNMGNITSLKRSGNHNNGSYGVIDDLTYSYNGYQLVAIDDAATSPTINDSFDFKDGADSSNEYLYDANGNMIQDKNKGIAQIQYNHLNMPTRITYDNGNMIDYLYSASGVKLEVTHTTNKLLMVNSNIGNSAAAKVSQKSRIRP